MASRAGGRRRVLFSHADHAACYRLRNRCPASRLAMRAAGHLLVAQRSCRTTAAV